jgi:hypothetical protein
MHRRLAIAALALAAISGCATQPASPFREELKPPVNGRIYIYRESSIIERLGTWGVWIDGKYHASLKNATYVVLDVSSDMSTLEVTHGGSAFCIDCKSKGDTKVSMKLPALTTGQTAYFRVFPFKGAADRYYGPYVGFVGGTFYEIQRVDRGVAHEAMAAMRLGEY